MNLEVEVAATPSLVSECLSLRRRVFVGEQSVPEGLELDGRDPECLHIAARADGKVVGTARLRIAPDQMAKAERVCVDSTFRGHGIGVRVMQVLEREAHAAGYAELVLSAQSAVVPFYERLGYVGEGEIFMEAGIPHLKMRKSLT